MYITLFMKKMQKIMISIETMDNIMNKKKPLYSGIFWIITEDNDFNNYEILAFPISCDIYGIPVENPIIELNSKNKKSYNHKNLWNNHVMNNNKYRQFNKKPYNYYPRGRVDISKNKAILFLNPCINKPKIIDGLITEFGLTTNNISEVVIKPDGSNHYKCFIDFDKNGG